MTITTVLVPPSRGSSPGTFANDMDALLSALPAWTAEANETAANIDLQLNPSAFRNRIINGDMRIDQRNGGAAVTSISSSGWAVDRFTTVSTAATSLLMTAQQVVDAPAGSGLTYSHKLTITTAVTSYGAGGRAGIAHRIEGYNTASLDFGSVNAKAVTLSFWVKSSVTGTHSVGLLNNDSTRSYPATFSIGSANTWEFKSITVPGETSGVWEKGSGRGMQIEFCIGADASRLGTANTWGTSFVTGATGAVQLASTLGATLNITGVQLEQGNTATAYEFLPYQVQLAMCQRYYEHPYDSGASIGTVNPAGTVIGRVMASTSTTVVFPGAIYKVAKRVNPTVVIYGGATGTAGKITSNGGTDQAGTAVPYYAGVSGFSAVQGSTSLVDTVAYSFGWAASAEL